MITLESSLIYLMIGVISFLTAYLGEKSKSPFSPIIVFLIYTFFSSFRAYTVGADTPSYVILFTNPQNFSTTKEIGFTLLNKLLISIINNPTFLFCCYSIIIYGLIIFRLWELREYVSFPCAIIAFYSIYYFESLNIMRQFVAVAIIFFCTRYLTKCKYIRFLVGVVIATLFHTSALLGIGYLLSEIFFIKRLTAKRRVLLISFLSLGLLALPYIFELGEKYTHYFNTTTVDLGLRVLALFIIWLLSLFYFKEDKKDKIDRKDEKTYLVHSVQLYYIIGCGLGIIGYFYEFMGRIAFYFSIFNGVLFGLIVKKKKNSTGKSFLRILLLIMIAFVIIYILYNYLFVLNGSRHHPYHFVWE